MRRCFNFFLVQKLSSTEVNHFYCPTRIFVWSRNKIVGMKDPGAFVMAVCELSGQVLLYDEEKFKTLDEDGVSAAMAEAVRETHMQKREEILRLFTGK